MRQSKRVLAAIVAFMFVAVPRALPQELPRSPPPGAEQTTPRGAVSTTDLPLMITDCNDERFKLEVSTQDKFVPKDIEDTKQFWFDRSVHWKRIYWASLVVSIVFGALATSSLISDGATWKLKSMCALIATLGSTLIATINPQLQSERYLNAYLYSRNAIMAYGIDPKMNACQLAKAYTIAENLLQRGSPGTTAATPK